MRRGLCAMDKSSVYFFTYTGNEREKKSRFYFVYPLLVVSLRKLNQMQYCISVCG
jgi:hypothetical protein